jgi:hypothetical protein
MNPILIVLLGAAVLTLAEIGAIALLVGVST